MRRTYGEGMKDMMWSMFWVTHDAYQADIDQLEKDIKTLIRMTTQKTAGQKPYATKEDISFDNLERIQMNIICGATVLYLTGALDELREALKAKEEKSNETHNR